MAKKKIVSVDENYDFPEKIRQRQQEIIRDTVEEMPRLGEDNLAALSADTSPFRPTERLDIWDGGAFQREYSQWISYLDSKLIGSVSSREIIGTAIGGREILAYTAGSIHAPTALIVSGQHGHEVQAQAAAGEFFIKFATSTHPSMVALRRRVQIVFVPTANPSGYYSTRENSAGIDINREWPFNWTYNASVDRGPTPFSQPESQAIKSLIDSRKIGLVVDCHNSGSTDPEMQISSAVDALFSKRRSISDAIQNWQISNSDAEPIKYFTPTDSINCTLANWAARYTRFNLGRENGHGVIIEGKPRGGNSGNNEMSRDGARYYASAVYHVVLSWLNNGQIDDTPASHTYWGTSLVSSAGSDLVGFYAPNGRLIDTTTYRPAHLQYTVAGNSRNYIGFPIKYPNRMFAEAQVELEGGSVASRIEGRLALGPIPLDGTDLAPLSSTTGSIDLPANGRGQLLLKATEVFSTVPDDSIYMLQIFLRVTAAPTGEGATWPRIRSASGIKADLRLDPIFEPFRVPRVSRP